MLALSGTVVIAATLFFLLQALAAVLWPSTLRRMLGGFAATARLHYIEMGMRILVGAAFVHFASQMAYEVVFRGFGYLLLVTTLVLLFVPWKLHRRFALWAVPLATRSLLPYALGSVLIGGFIVYAFVVGSPD